MANKQRNSSFELLRIVLILLVIIGHANMWFLYAYYPTDTEHWVRSLVQSVCMPAVDGFVLLSGWFGIHGGYKRIMPLLFQVILCTLPLCIIFWALGKIAPLSINGVYIYLFGGNNYWFVFNYIALILFTPFLNAAIENMERLKMKKFLVSSFLFILPLDVVFRTNVIGVEGGYSIIWFIYLYLLARYLRLYGCKFIYNYKWMLLVGCVVLQTILSYYGLIGTRYTNPLILLPAICLLLIFSKYEFHNKLINFIAPAALMAYMLHMQPCLVDYIRTILNTLYKSHGYWLYMLEVMGMVIVLYIAAIIFNQLANYLYKFLQQK